MWKLCRFQIGKGPAQAGFFKDDHVLDLGAAGITRLTALFEEDGMLRRLEELSGWDLPRHSLDSVTLLTPVEGQEVWAAGVTYLRSKSARMEESDFSANAYDRVYEAARPELFFKALPEKVAPPGDAVGIRRDATWNVPEPELVLVFNSKGALVGYTAGNDMSSRDIEGENLLYLPQAKVYDRSCAIGPCVTVGVGEPQAREWLIALEIVRQGKTVFGGTTTVSQIKRSFAELGDYLWRSQTFPNGVMLLTGTGVVPGDEFTLQAGDSVSIEISGVGRLENSVVVV